MKHTLIFLHLHKARKEIGWTHKKNMKYNGEVIFGTVAINYIPMVTFQLSSTLFGTQYYI